MRLNDEISDEITEEAISLASISSAWDLGIWIKSRARISSGFRPMKSGVVLSGRDRVRQLDYSALLIPS